jgi:hypothetical protein
MPDNNQPIADPTPAAPPAEPQQSAMPASYDEWIAGQDETVKTLITGRFQALENTVKSTRDERDDFKKQLKDLSKKAADGSELKQQLDTMTAQLEKTERRAAFMEEAIKPEIQCRNARAAWLLAIAEDLFSKNGSPDWAAIKREAPELFGVPTANANAGANTQSPPPKQSDMNAFIRSRAGRA